MAVLKVKRQGHLCTSGRNFDEKTATEYYMVQFDAAATPVQAETADDGVDAIPALGAGLDGDTDRVVVNVDAKPMDDSPRLAFQVQVDYSDAYDETFITSPLADDPLVTWDFSAASETYFLDNSATPKPTINSAGETFEKLLERETGTVVATIKQNIAPEDWDASVAALYMKPTATNSDTITVDGQAIGIGQARLGGISLGELQERNSVEYRVRTIVLKLRASWDDVVEDRGFNEAHAIAAGPPQVVTTVKPIIKGVPPAAPQHPWPLDGAGAAKTNIGDTPATLTFVPYPARVFAIWNFA